jgi:chemotaxis protein MotA
MDSTTIIGIVAGIGAMLLGFMMEGGHAGALFAPSAAVIVFGGTIGATVVGCSLEELRTVPNILKIVFTSQKYDPQTKIRDLSTLAEKARREGLLSLEQEAENVEDKFMRQGLQLVVDGTDPQLTRNILETEMYSVEQRHKSGIDIFEAAGGYAPTMGIIGTVMGLVHVLGNLMNPDELGPAIAVAFIATLYGVCSANLLWLPIATKLKNKSHKERLIREMVLEGILSIQAGESPMIIREKLLAFLKPKERVLDKADAAEGLGAGA